MLHRSNLVHKHGAPSYSGVVRVQGKRIAVIDNLRFEGTVVHTGPQDSVLFDHEEARSGKGERGTDEVLTDCFPSVLPDGLLLWEQ